MLLVLLLLSIVAITLTERREQLVIDLEEEEEEEEDKEGRLEGREEWVRGVWQNICSLARSVPWGLRGLGRGLGREEYIHVI